MVTTFNALVDRTLGQIQGYGSQQDTSTWLKQEGGIDASAIQFIVNETAQISRGMIEVDDELMYVDRVDNLTKTVYLPPWGRGYRGTTAVGHANLAQLTVASTYPRYLVRQALNETIVASYPDLFGVGKTTLSFNAAVNTYELPADADYILSIKWRVLGPTKEWVPARRYRFDKSANTDLFPSGRTVSLFDGIMPGRPVEIVYMKAPSMFVDGAEEFDVVTGLPSSCEDVIVYGAMARMLANSDAARIPAVSAEADVLDSTKPLGTATSIAKYYFALYQQRLAVESQKLRNLYPTRINYTR